MSLWIDLYYKNSARKDKFAGYYEIHKVPVRFIEGRIKTASETLHMYQNKYQLPEEIQSLELALDYLFAELGRRANRAVIK